MASKSYKRYRLEFRYHDGSLITEKTGEFCCLASVKEYVQRFDDLETPKFRAAHPKRYVEIYEESLVEKWIPDTK